MRSRARTLLLLPVVLLLASCAATSLPEFDAAQTDRDIIPDPSSQSDVDSSTTRFVGEVEGADLYLARGNNDTVCLIHIRDEEWEQMGCGAGSGIGTELDSGTRIEVGTFKFTPDEVGDGERTHLSDSVTVITYP
jgi:hypothetical protein